MLAGAIQDNEVIDRLSIAAGGGFPFESSFLHINTNFCIVPNLPAASNVMFVVFQFVLPFKLPVIAYLLAGSFPCDNSYSTGTIYTFK